MPRNTRRDYARRIVTIEDYLTLPKAERERRGDAIRALDLAARTRITVEEAARRERVPWSEIQFWVREGLGTSAGGKTYPAAQDRLLRPRIVALADPPEFAAIAAHGRREALKAERAFGIQWRFIHGRSTEQDLRALAGQRFSGRRVLADPEELLRLAIATDLEDIIRGT